MGWTSPYSKIATEEAVVKQSDYSSRRHIPSSVFLTDRLSLSSGDTLGIGISRSDFCMEFSIRISIWSHPFKTFCARQHKIFPLFPFPFQLPKALHGDLWPPWDGLRKPQQHRVPERRQWLRFKRKEEEEEPARAARANPGVGALTPSVKGYAGTAAIAAAKVLFSWVWLIVPVMSTAWMMVRPGGRPQPGRPTHNSGINPAILASHLWNVLC
jgi:hypothetical protein